LRATYEQLSRFCAVGRALRQQFDNDPALGAHPKQTAAYFNHIHDCIVCRRARAALLREHDRAKSKR